MFTLKLPLQTLLRFTSIFCGATQAHFVKSDVFEWIHAAASMLELIIMKPGLENHAHLSLGLD